jgi:hypothetical protein
MVRACRWARLVISRKDGRVSSNAVYKWATVDQQGDINLYIWRSFTTWQVKVNLSGIKLFHRTLALGNDLTLPGKRYEL